MKFLSGRPDPQAVKRILEKNPLVQFAAVTGGDYDLFVYLLAENTKVLEDWVYGVRSDKVFEDYDANWYISYITYSFGYVPFRGEFMDWLKGKVWHKSRETPRRLPGQLLEREYTVLKELNANCRMDFKKIDEKYNLGTGSAYYTYYKLLEGKFIERATIALRRPPTKYDVLATINQVSMRSFNKAKKSYLMHLMEDSSRPTNTYTLVGDIGSPYNGFLHILPVYGEGGKELAEMGLTSMLKKIALNTAIITNPLVGMLGHQKMPPEETRQHKIIISEENK